MTDVYADKVKRLVFVYSIAKIEPGKLILTQCRQPPRSHLLNDRNRRRCQSVRIEYDCDDYEGIILISSLSLYSLLLNQKCNNISSRILRIQVGSVHVCFQN